MGFERALAALKAGQRVSRAGWNGKDMWLAVFKGVPVQLLSKRDLDGYNPRPLEVYYPPHIAMFTAQGGFVPWLASVTDLMAEDWEVVE